MKHILSLGLGVQSSTLALMAAHGKVKGYPKLDAAIFADTQDEPSEVYIWYHWLKEQIAKSLNPFPIYRVTNGKLSEKLLQGRADVPFFGKHPNGDVGFLGRRTCTADFKLKPIMAKIRELGQVPRKTKDHTPHVTQWIGISLDEIYRMKPSREWWAVNKWPLVDMRMSRHDCKRWMQSMGYPEPPRSACIYCPYHSNHEWRRIKEYHPSEFAEAVRLEKLSQAAIAEKGRLRTTPFFHRSLKPLDQVDFSTDEDRGQLNLFNNECEGMCGV